MIWKKSWQYTQLPVKQKLIILFVKSESNTYYLLMYAYFVHVTIITYYYTYTEIMISKLIHVVGFQFCVFSPFFHLCKIVPRYSSQFFLWELTICIGGLVDIILRITHSTRQYLRLKNLFQQMFSKLLYIFDCTRGSVDLPTSGQHQ